MRRSSTGIVVAAAVSTVVAVLLAGCTAPEPSRTEPSPSVASPSQPDEAAQTWPGPEVTGTGRQSVTAEVPSGAKSIRIAFVCTGGMFVLSTGDDLAGDRSGACVGPRSFTLPIVSSPTFVVSVSIEEDATFALTSTFTSARTIPDTAIAEECAALSGIESALLNAGEGYDAGDVTADSWRAVAARAAKDLTALSSTAQGLVGQQVDALVAAFEAEHPDPAFFLASPASSAALDLASQVCGDNGTPISITSQYGG